MSIKNRIRSCYGIALALGTLTVSQAQAQADLQQANALKAASSLSSTQTLVAQAQQAFVGQQAIHTVTMTGTLTRDAGSLHEEGSVTLVARADGSGDIQMVLNDDTRSEHYSTTDDSSTCTEASILEGSNTVANHNCLHTALWFLPAMSLVGPVQAGAVNWKSNPSVSLGIDLSLAKPLLSFPSIGSSHLYLDSNLNPTLFICSKHADLNANVSIEIEATFTDYRLVKGVSLPFRIKQFHQNQPVLDIVLSSAEVN